MANERMGMIFEEAVACKKGLDKGAASIDQAIKALAGVIQNLERAWEGNTSRGFVEEYRNVLEKNLNSVQQAVLKTATDLQKDINKWEAFDNK